GLRSDPLDLTRSVQGLELPVARIEPPKPGLGRHQQVTAVKPRQVGLVFGEFVEGVELRRPAESPALPIECDHASKRLTLAFFEAQHEELRFAEHQAYGAIAAGPWTLEQPFHSGRGLFGRERADTKRAYPIASPGGLDDVRVSEPTRL